ncbi:MAG TPA: hypothetical protein VFG66_13325 [Gemmatimonadales bacterium]|nr:hypothetical protein [Gemmatimonadales bacterium]
MLQFARVLTASLALALLPGASEAQSTPPAAPILERRVMPVRAEPDPWLISYFGLSARTARANLALLDRALVPYGTSYTRLPVEERARVRQAFDDLVPRQSISRYSVTEPQARAIAYLALGPSGRAGRDCDGARRRGRASRCDQAMDSMSRHAAWIHATALALGRTGNRRPRALELADLGAMNEHARAMVVGAPGCGCPAARQESEALLTVTREAVDAYERSSMPAWMSIGDQRVQRIARLSESLERTYLGCGSPT